MMQKITDCLVKNNKQFLLAFLFIVLFSVENIAAIYLSTGGFAYPTFFLKFVVKFFFFNALVSIIILMLPRILSYLIVFINSLLNIFIFSWHHFLGDTPSFSAVKTCFGSELLDGINLFSYIDIKSLLFIIFAFTINCYIIYNVRIRSICLKLVSIVSCFIIIFSTGSIYLKKHELSLFTIGRMSIPSNIEFRGYISTWLAEYIYPIKTGSLMTCSSEKADHIPLFPSSNKIVYIQVECLDMAIIGYKINEHIVMPFLSNIVDRGLVLHVDGQKKLTSSNSDYELLNTKIAHPSTVYYNTLTSYLDSIPLQFKNKGAELAFFHGLYDVSGMRKAYPLMGFDKLALREELVAAGYQLNNATPQHIDDRDLFSYAAKQVPHDKPFFHVIITMNMHDPAKNNINPLFKGDSDEGFFTNARITDDGIRAYVESLPAGTDVLIMGDHTPYHGPRSVHVPLILYRTGEPVPMKSPDISLTRCEASQYLRRVFDLPPVSPDIPVVEEMCR